MKKQIIKTLGFLLLTYITMFGYNSCSFKNKKFVSINSSCKDTISFNAGYYQRVFYINKVRKEYKAQYDVNFRYIVLDEWHFCGSEKKANICILPKIKRDFLGRPNKIDYITEYGDYFFLIEE